MLLIVVLAFAIFTYPLYTLLGMHIPLFFWIALLGFALLASCAVGVIPTTLAEMFPTVVRNSGVAFSYNIGFAIFGGLSPLAATLLIHHFNSANALALNIVCVASVLFFILLPMRLPKNKKLGSR